MKKINSNNKIWTIIKAIRNITYGVKKTYIEKKSKKETTQQEHTLILLLQCKTQENKICRKKDVASSKMKMVSVMYLLENSFTIKMSFFLTLS